MVVIRSFIVVLVGNFDACFMFLVMIDRDCLGYPMQMLHCFALVLFRHVISLASKLNFSLNLSRIGRALTGPYLAETDQVADKKPMHVVRARARLGPAST
jgi:hypothetical protein